MAVVHAERVCQNVCVRLYTIDTPVHIDKDNDLVEAFSTSQFVIGIHVNQRGGKSVKRKFHDWQLLTTSERKEEESNSGVREMLPSLAIVAVLTEVEAFASELSSLAPTT